MTELGHADIGGEGSRSSAYAPYEYPRVISRLSCALIGQRAEYRHAGARHREQRRGAMAAVGTAEAHHRRIHPFEPAPIH